MRQRFKRAIPLSVLLAIVIITAVAIKLQTPEDSRPHRERAEDPVTAASKSPSPSDNRSVAAPQQESPASVNLEPQDIADVPENPNPLLLSKKALWDVTKLKGVLIKRRAEAEVKVGKAAKDMGDFEEVFESMVHRIGPSVHGIAIAQALQAEDTKAIFREIMQSTGSFIDLKARLDNISHSERLGVNFLTAATPEDLVHYCVTTENLFQERYATLVEKFELPASILPDVQTMLANRELVRIIDLDMTFRGYSWDNDSQRFTRGP